MMTDELVAMSQDHDTSHRMATKRFLITGILFSHQIAAV